VSKYYINLSVQNFNEAVKQGYEPLGWINEESVILSKFEGTAEKSIAISNGMIDICKKTNLIENGYKEIVSFSEIISLAN
jgi:hypothetical protein